MWSNIAMALIGAAFIGTAATLGVIYWDDIRKNKVFSNLANDVEEMLKISELAISLESEPATLTADELKYTPYSDNDSSKSTDEEMTFGKKYGKLLVGDKNNDSDWWKSNFDKQKGHIKQFEKSIFSGIKGENEKPEELKAKCETAYKKKIKEIDAKDIENIWLLCSPMKYAPSPIIMRRKIYKDKFGSTETYKQYFLENRPSNKNAWEIIYDKFVKGATETKSTEFSQVKKGYSKNENDSLNKVCAEAYMKNSSEIEKTEKSDYKANVLKFCTFTLTNLNTSS